MTALFVGLWFVAIAAGPELTHACATHGAAANVLAASAHQGHGDHSSVPDHGGQCSCLGSCSATGPVATVPPVFALADVVSAASHNHGLPDYAYVPVAARHVLPLAHAPPPSA